MQVEIQPVTVSKSTLALYSVDGMATALQMNIFLEAFTNICGVLYRTPLTTGTVERDRTRDGPRELTCAVDPWAGVAYRGSEEGGNLRRLRRPVRHQHDRI